MAIDKALWFSVRPRFGVLAREIEIVAKETISGKDLEIALFDFTKKYDSPLLKRSINLLIEGLRAGGEVGDLLNRISANIAEARLMKKEMSANVTTYVIFITFATVIAAPVLFALSNQLLNIINNLITTISRPDATTGGFASAFSTLAVKPGDFNFFAVFMLSVTSFFSASIIAIIRRGSIKGGLKYIPTFIIISITLFYIANYVLSISLGQMLI
jgi:archaellum biogenesis protein FlaJ (TadC family)